eukprot:symbB.v1.2.024410.t1/scaffold2220.1/size89589/5
MPAEEWKDPTLARCSSHKAWISSLRSNGGGSVCPSLRPAPPVQPHATLPSQSLRGASQPRYLPLIRPSSCWTLLVKSKQMTWR